MIQCLNPSCLKMIGDGDSFCGYCGEDNRPPLKRSAIPAHDHACSKDGFYCSVCGERVREAPTGRRPFAGTLMLVGSAPFWACLVWLLFAFPVEDAIVFEVLTGCIGLYLFVTGLRLVRKKKPFRLELRK